MDEILEKAKQTVLANVVKNTSLGKTCRYVVAGGHQFKTLWVRDFCYSVPGLLMMGEKQLVLDQLRLIYQFKNQKHQLPRGLDVLNPKMRVLWKTFLPGLRFPESRGSYEKHAIVPEYFGEHGTVAYDSNLLFLRSALESDFISELSQAQIQDLLSVYSFSPWITQPAFSDWQDSVRRTGPILLTQLLYLEVMLGLQARGLAHKNLDFDFLAENLKSAFQISGQPLFRETLESDQISIDSHALLLTGSRALQQLLGLDTNQIYRALKSSLLWTASPIPGVPVHPLHPTDHVAWTVKLVGLRHYHDHFVWGWLAAEAYKITAVMKDNAEAQRILAEFVKANHNQQWLSEIYSFDKTSLKPFQGAFYQTERPFTWTSAKWIEALCQPR
jgi:hypothetical protein